MSRTELNAACEESALLSFGHAQASAKSAETGVAKRMGDRERENLRWMDGKRGETSWANLCPNPADTPNACVCMLRD